jgi:dihydroorotase
MDHQKQETVLRGGRVIDPESGFDQTADVLIEDGLVTAIETTPGKISSKSTSDNTLVLNVEGCLVTPGLIDPHVHLREPSINQLHTETIATGSRGAVCGGFTTVCCMPNTSPALDCLDVLALVQQQSKKSLAAGGSRVFAVVCATLGRKGHEQVNFQALAEAGAVGFSDDGDAVARDDVMAIVLKNVKDVDSVFMQHCQDPAMTVGSVMNTSPTATRLGLIGWPPVAESSILERDLKLNADIGAKYHAQHLSARESIDALRDAQNAGQQASGEASPHHLLLTDEFCDNYNTQAKINPPLRSAEDVEALRNAIAEGVVTVLATDHAPHPAQTKDTDFASAAFGTIGLECALPLYAKALIETGVLDWPAMLAMLTINPARLVGLDQHGYGSLKIGHRADITVIDPEMKWTVNPADFQSPCTNSMFAGFSVKSRAVATIVGGRLVHAEKAILSTNLPPHHPQSQPTAIS